MTEATTHFHDIIEDIVQRAEAGGDDPHEIYQHLTAFCRLTPVQQVVFKDRLKAALGSRFSKTDFARQVRERTIALRREEYELEDHRRTISTTDRPTRDILNDAIDALRAFNDPAKLFIQYGRLVRVRHDEFGRPSIEQVDKDLMLLLLAKACNFVRQTGDGPMHISPPEDICRTLIREEDLPFPHLDGITAIPVVRPDGTILEKQGYDEQSRLYLASTEDLQGIKTEDLPDIKEARRLLHRVFKDFPFDRNADYANFIGLLLTPIIRHHIQGNAPIAVIDSPQMGTGKSLLSDAVSLVTMGAITTKTTPPTSPEEWAKVITSLLIQGSAVIQIDNVDKAVNSPDLATAVTTDTWSGRVLGRSQIATLPSKATWVLNGNNVDLAGDMKRRCYWIRLNAKTNQPWMRRDFEIRDLPRFIKENRRQLVMALLSHVEHWKACDCPEETQVSVGGFERWSRITGGIMRACGYRSFLSNIQLMYEVQGDDEKDWVVFLQELRRKFKYGFNTHQLLETLRDEGDLLHRLMPSDFQRALSKRGVQTRYIGWVLRNNMEKRYGDEGWYLYRSEEEGARYTIWMVEVDQPDEPRQAAMDLPDGDDVNMDDPPF